MLALSKMQVATNVFGTCEGCLGAGVFACDRLGAGAA